MGPDEAAPPIVQVGRFGTRLGDPEALQQAREAFSTRHLIRLPGFLHPDLLDHLRQALDHTNWVVRIHDALTPPAIDLGVRDPAILGLLIFLLNDRALFETMQTLTGARGIECFWPAIYKMVPGEGHRDTWHDDVDGNRLVAMSINLSREPFEGGVLRVRRKHEEEPIVSIQNQGPGDALLFRIDEALEHCLTEVVGRVPKLTLVGWFQRSPAYTTLMRGAE